jgi:hypothetical protein
VRFGRAVFRFTEVAPRRKPQPLRRISLVRSRRHPTPDSTAGHCPAVRLC